MVYTAGFPLTKARKEVVMRLFVAVSLLTIVAAGTAAAQTARCVLSLRPYGLGGECQVEAGPPGTRMRLPFENGVCERCTNVACIQ